MCRLENSNLGRGHTNDDMLFIVVNFHLLQYFLFACDRNILEIYCNILLENNNENCHRNHFFQKTTAKAKLS